MWRVLDVVTTGEVIIVTRDTPVTPPHLASQFVWNIMTPICSEQSSTQTANTAGGWWHVKHEYYIGNYFITSGGHISMFGPK